MRPKPLRGFSRRGGLLAMLAIFLVDQITKALVLDSISYGETIRVTDFLNLVLTYNRGVTFGMLKAYSDIGFYALTGAIIAVIALVFRWWLKAENRCQSYTAAMIVAGALGNLSDRLRFRAVVDFIDFHINGWHWYAFNVADSSIVCGVIVLLLTNRATADEKAAE